MHLLKAAPGRIEEAGQAVRLEQSPGEIVFISAADTELAALAVARRACPQDFPALRVANLLRLGHPLSVDLYVDNVLRHARLVIVRLIGGTSYWPYGIERIAALAAGNGTLCAFLPGDERRDETLMQTSTLRGDAVERLWRYCLEAGPDNMRGLLDYAAALIGRPAAWREPAPLPRAGFYWPGTAAPSLADIAARWRSDRALVPIVFYRALFQSSDLAPIDGLIAALAARGLDTLPIHVASLRDPASAALIEAAFARHPPAVILNATGFAVSAPGADGISTPFAAADCPVLQVILSSQDEATWRQGMAGLAARDLAMNVALPEIDGRIITRAISFKSADEHDPLVDSPIARHRPLPDRLDFAADLAAGWARLRTTAPGKRRVALVIASYPGLDGRIGCGVGLDTPASAIRILEALTAEGYRVGAIPRDGDALMRLLERAEISFSLDSFRRFLLRLPHPAQEAIQMRWGDLAEKNGGGTALSLRVLALGNVAILAQPSRGSGIDPRKVHHDLTLVPPPDYIAAYAWLRQEFGAHAVIHLGKHGTLEWLPGKALALSAECWPELVLGPLPHLYPFIVNDPGEGSQAKRRSQAVIVDHLTPPLTRAASYGPLAELESLVDEYYQAAGVDPRRLVLLRDSILDLAARSGLDRDCGIDPGEAGDGALAKIDNFLCELKEMQIRDGLHVFGVSPEGERLTDLLVALTRQPRGKGEGGDASLTRALARDLGLDAFDPLTADLGQQWQGPRPAVLRGAGAWRTQGDTVERLEGLARSLVAGERACDAGWARARAVLAEIDDRLRPNLQNCARDEMAGLLRGLAGRFVPPGPSGAPTRGRLDVLPTGRNFHAIDSRAIPTPTAWQLGWRAADMLIDRYRQENGDWPKRFVVTAWGTANMRTGGDDLAQALALMGVRPTWDGPSNRVTGYEILPLSILDRPRVDVTLRISGFFRDAFPVQIELFDAAARAVAALDEPGDVNPLAARVGAESAMLERRGLPPAAARRQAGARIFGAAPGRYGSGLERMIEEPDAPIDPAGAYLAAGGFGYGVGMAGDALHERFEARLAGAEAVVQSQDNREHDLLDSDAYYGFEAGLAATIEKLSGSLPAILHADTSLPERPAIRTLAEEMARVVRARAANPKWIDGVMRHGHKGAAEIATTVEHLCAFAALVPVVAEHHFEAVYQAYVADEAVFNFLKAHNPGAARSVGRRLLATMDAGRWQPRSNSARRRLEELAA